MKLYLLVGFIFIQSAVAFGQHADLFFMDKTHRFPKTEAGAILTHTYTFVNKGDAPLIIDEAKVACTCTKITYPKTPIMPSDTSQIIVSFNTMEVIGWQDRTIAIKSNSSNGMEVLRFKVMVKNK